MLRLLTLFLVFLFFPFLNFCFNRTVSNLALAEYENLHGKYEVEQNCRNKAEEFATNVRLLWHLFNGRIIL